MDEIQLSVMHHTDQTQATLENLLKQFESQHRIRVKLQLLEWTTARSELNKVAMYRRGPDVSEIGTTWVHDLIAMNALHSFNHAELSQVGRAEEFLAPAWQTGHIIDDPRIWAIPWVAEAFVIHYRKDILEQAGIDESTAFVTHARLEDTINRLNESGVTLPFELPHQRDTFTNLHCLASWVWRNGGEFCSPDGKKVLFDQPAALAAIKTYFSLLCSLTPEGRHMMLDRPEFYFPQGKSAITFGTLMLTQSRPNIPQQVKDNWCAAPMPSPCFVGGSDLVVWEHARFKRAAVELVRFLVSPAIQEQLHRPMGVIPARLSALESADIMDDPIRRVLVQAARMSRPYLPVPLWGLIEDRLVETLIQIGDEILSHPEADADAIITQKINSTARKLNVALSQ